MFVDCANVPIWMLIISPTITIVCVDDATPAVELLLSAH